MSTRFDELTRRAGTLRSRRQVIGLFGRTAIGAFVGVQALQFLDAPAVLAEDCLVEYPPANIDDCPNKRKHPGNVPGSNGCGAATMEFRPPQSFGSVDFTPWCNNHDVCYGTCGSSRIGCDVTFGDQLTDACIATYSDNYIMETLCITVAGVYQAAVTIGGANAWDSGQKKDCECCRPTGKVRCGCTGACYDDALVCLSECKASLGCFTDICMPALAGQCN